MITEDNPTEAIHQAPRKVRLREAVVVNPRGFSEPVGDDDLVSFVPMKAVGAEDRKIDLSDRRRWREVKKGYTTFEDGDVLFAKITPCMENGKFALATGLEGGRAAGSTEFHVLRPKEGLLPAYLMWFLFSPRVRDGAKTSMGGAVGQQRVPTSYLESLEIPLPSLKDQAGLVKAIDGNISKLDEAAEALNRAQANLKRYRASVLKAACEGRLVPTEAELARNEGRNYESGEQLLTRVRAERRNLYPPNGRYAEPRHAVGPVPETLPEGWGYASIEQLAGRVTVGFVGSMKHEYVSEGVAFLRSQNIRENRFDPSGLLCISPDFHARLRKSKVSPGDLAVVRSGSVGVTCVIPEGLGEANCADLVLIQNPIGFVPQFGAYFMNSIARVRVSAGKVGVALAHFNTQSVAGLGMPLPPFAEQLRIVERAEELLAKAAEAEELIKQSIEGAATLRSSVLKRAFTSF